MLLAALVVVGAIVWLLVAQPWRSVAAAPEPSVSPSPGASASPTAADALDAPAEQSPAPEDASATPGETPDAEPCLPGDLLVEALTDQSTYATGQNPQLSIRLTNRSERDCTLNVGTSAQSFTISSGPDVWWRSTDCQTEPSDMIVLLAAGQQTTSATPLTWDRTRSSVDTCDGERPAAPGGGATYHLSVAIGNIAASNTAPFQLY